MAPWLMPLIAVVSTASCLFLWFRDVRRIMQERKSTVESACGQLAACRENLRKVRGDPDTAAVLERSESIYQQAVDLYNRTLQKPSICLPAHLMGYHHIS